MSPDAFDATQGLIVVKTEIAGPLGMAYAKLALDTGATLTLIDLDILLSLGYDPDQSSRRIPVTTGSAVETVPLIILNRLTAMGRHRIGLPVIAHSLPPSAKIDGLLGLDFFRGQSLTIDFRAGLLTLG